MELQSSLSSSLMQEAAGLGCTLRLDVSTYPLWQHSVSSHCVQANDGVSLPLQTSTKHARYAKLTHKVGSENVFLAHKRCTIQSSTTLSSPSSKP